VKNLINSVAKDMGLKISDVEKIFEAPFDLQAIIMKYRCDKDKEEYPSLRIPYFLLFYCPPWNKARLQKKFKKRQDEINRSNK
jgi:hypothetical protein